LYSFGGSPDAVSPAAGLIADGAGNFYGTATAGGKNAKGAVFELSPVAGGEFNETVLYDFARQADGGGPALPFLMDAARNLYGTTKVGGTGNGVVFELSRQANKWKETVLYTFAGGSDGKFPVAGLVLDASGNLLGTTSRGGASDLGVVFQLSPSPSGWTEKVIHSFKAGTDGNQPQAGLVFDRSGRLYGVTLDGGIYRLTRNKKTGVWHYKQLYCMCNTQSASVYGDVLVDSHFHIYGTANSAQNESLGMVFEVAHVSGVWTLSKLHGFSGKPDGSMPRTGLVRDAAGNLYGTTLMGGANNFGAVFKVSQSGGQWNETVVYSLAGPIGDGSGPLGDLL